MTTTTSSRHVPGAALFSAAVFVVALIGLHGAPIHLPHQGVQSVLAADALVHGRGFEVAPGLPYTKFGPLYPALLAGLAVARLDVNAAVYAINCLAFAASLFGLYLLCRPFAPRGAWAAMAFFLLWAPNHYLLRGARPDLLVLCLTILALAGASRYVRRSSHAMLLVTAVLCSAASCGRYMAALTLVPVVFLAIAFRGTVPRTRRLVDLGVFGGIAYGPVAIWLARNYRLTGFPSGMSRTAERPGMENTGLLDNLRDLLETVYVDAFAFDALGIRQVLHGSTPLAHRFVVAAAAIAFLAVVAIVLWRRREAIRTFAVDRLRGRSSADAGIVLISVYALWHVLALLVVWTLSNNDPINTRYVSAVYGFVIALGTVFLATALGGERAAWPKIALAVAVLLAAVPNTARSARLLKGDPPGRRLVNVTKISQRGSNWVPELSWQELDSIRIDPVPEDGP